MTLLRVIWIVSSPSSKLVVEKGDDNRLARLAGCKFEGAGGELGVSTGCGGPTGDGVCDGRRQAHVA